MGWKVPTIGRIVHYRHMDVILPAIILNVKQKADAEAGSFDVVVDLQVFGLPEDQIKINVEQGEKAGQWRWPPRD